MVRVKIHFATKTFLLQRRDDKGSWRYKQLHTSICVCLASAPLVCLHVVNVYANVHQVYLSHMWQRNEKKSLICADGAKEERRRWKMERFLFGEWEEEKSLSELLWWTERNIVRLQNELWAADGAESAPLNKLWNDEQAEGERKGFCWCISPSSLRMK